MAVGGQSVSGHFMIPKMRGKHSYFRYVEVGPKEDAQSSHPVLICPFSQQTIAGDGRAVVVASGAVRRSPGPHQASLQLGCFITVPESC